MNSGWLVILSVLLSIAAMSMAAVTLLDQPAQNQAVAVVDMTGLTKSKVLELAQSNLGRRQSNIVRANGRRARDEAAATGGSLQSRDPAERGRRIWCAGHYAAANPPVKAQGRAMITGVRLFRLVLVWASAWLL